MLDFYRYFYRKSIKVDKSIDALNAWLHKHLSVTEDLNPEVVVEERCGLQFVPAFEMTVPHVVNIVEFRGIDAEIVRVYCEIHLGEWNTETYEEVLYKEYLPQILTDFFGICDPEEDLIVPEIGLFTARFMRHKNPRRLISYPPCKCKGCSSPICPVRKRRKPRR